MAGQRPTDPMNLPRGFKPPSIDQARFPAHKTWLMEHHWLQNVSANECSRRLNGYWFLEGDGCYDGCEPSHYNAHPDSEPVVVFADGSAGTYAMNDFLIDLALIERHFQNNFGEPNCCKKLGLNDPKPSNFHLGFAPPHLMERPI